MAPTLTVHCFERELNVLWRSKEGVVFVETKFEFLYTISVREDLFTKGVQHMDSSAYERILFDVLHSRSYISEGAETYNP